MSASIFIPSEYNRGYIAFLAGCTDLSKQTYEENGTFTVEGVTQEALDAALQKYVLKKDDFKKCVNTLAEETRQKIITPGAGQIYVYHEKLEEAKSFIANGYPEENDDDYPFLLYESKAYSNTKAKVADLIISSHQTTNLKMAKIEDVRRKALLNIDASTDKTEIENIFNQSIVDFANAVL